MEILLEDYKRRLKTVQEMFQETDNYSQAIKLNVKINMCKEFIIEIERAIERGKKPEIQLDIKKLKEDWENHKKHNEVGPTCEDFFNEPFYIKLYWTACVFIFTKHKLAEEWLDDNSQYLPTNVSSVEEARIEIIKVINGKRA